MGATACLGEVPTGVLRCTEQWGILGLHAPRPLLGIAGSQDAPYFQPALMLETLAKTRDRVYRLYGAGDLVRGEAVDSPHGYDRKMHELFYNHAAKYLQGAPDPHIVEPAVLPVESVETLRCGLPPEGESVQSLTFRRAREMAAAVPVPLSAARWQAQKTNMLARLRADVFGGFPDAAQVSRTQVRTFDGNGRRVEHWTFETEPGVIVPVVLHLPDGVSTNARRPAVLVVGDVGHLASCVAPRPLLLVNAVDGRRRPVADPAWDDATRFTRDVFDLNHAASRLCRELVDPGAVPDRLAAWLRDASGEGKH